MRLATILTPRGPRAAVPAGDAYVDLHATDPALPTCVKHLLGSPAVRKAAAETINKRFGEQVYNWWWSWTLWGVITGPYVNGVETNTFPDGTKGVGLAFAGRHQLNQIWCDNGECE